VRSRREAGKGVKFQGLVRRFRACDEEAPEALRECFRLSLPCHGTGLVQRGYGGIPEEEVGILGEADGAYDVEAVPSKVVEDLPTGLFRWVEVEARLCSQPEGAGLAVVADGNTRLAYVAEHGRRIEGDPSESSRADNVLATGLFCSTGMVVLEDGTPLDKTPCPWPRVGSQTVDESEAMYAAPGALSLVEGL